MNARSSVNRLLALAALTVSVSCASAQNGLSNSPDPAPWAAAAAKGSPQSVPALPTEVRLKELRRITFGGQNAEAYWSTDGRQLMLQSRAVGDTCDRIYRFDVPLSEPGLAGLERTPASPGAGLRDLTGPAVRFNPVSDGEGATTCSYFLPGDQEAIFASTATGGKACPPKADRSKGYVWALYPDYEIFKTTVDGKPLQRLTDSPGYDAEGTVCRKDGSIVFTSVRDGDLELYRMDRDGKNVKRLTHAVGYDGGAFFNDDCTRLVWRASRPKAGAELNEYQSLLKQNLVKPGQLEIWLGNADGSDAHQITWLGAASFGPSFLPGGKRIIFSSNYGDPSGREFNLFAVDLDGSHLEQVTFAPGFDGFPLISPDGKLMIFASNRTSAPGSHETDLFLASWDGNAEPVYLPNRADTVRADVEYLADPAREGRGVGTQGLEAAGTYIADRYQALGLSPAGDIVDGKATFRNAFQVPLSAKVATTTALTLDGAVIPADQYRPLAWSTNADISGPLVFADYGIHRADLGRDDYLGIEVKGKIVVVRRFAPGWGKFDNTAEQRRVGDLHAKAFAAREAGAKALIVVDVPERAPDAPADWQMPKEAPLPSLDVEELGDAGIPVIVLQRAPGQALIDALTAPTPAAISPRRGAGRMGPGVRHMGRVVVALELQKSPAFNVVAKVVAGAPDSEKLPGVIVIGAHYDHLGYGGMGSLDPDSKLPHLGADDNASGTAALMEIARILMSERTRLKRDVIVVSFSGEERGLLGSTAFTRAPPSGLSIKDIKAMINLDMVGRLRESRLTVLGGDSAAEWPELVKGACEEERIECTVSGEGYGPSDQTPFFASGIPVIHFFTGAHGDYHKPSDSAALVNSAGVAAVAKIAVAAVVNTAAFAKPMTYKNAPAPLPHGDMRSFRASLGTIPNYAGPPEGSPPGMLLDGVRKGGPADKAGLQRGDILVHLGPHAIRGVEDLMQVLMESKPGETMRAQAVRDGKTIEVEVTLAESRL